ncbi:MAG: hypothetical protein AAFO76_12605, partial [Cyanobacteria bacterium J06607_15]
GLSELQARNIEVVQSAVNRLETRGMHQTFAAVNPMFLVDLPPTGLLQYCVPEAQINLQK